MSDEGPPQFRRRAVWLVREWSGVVSRGYFALLLAVLSGIACAALDAPLWFGFVLAAIFGLFVVPWVFWRRSSVSGDTP